MRERLKLHFAGELHHDLVEALRELPGLGHGTRELRGRSTVYVPPNAYFLVAHMLAAWGASGYTVRGAGLGGALGEDTTPGVRCVNCSGASLIVEMQAATGPLGDTAPAKAPCVECDAEVMRASLASEAHAWLWGSDAPTAVQPIRLLSYQKDAITFGSRRGSAHIWARPGSGKTVVADVWALSTPGPAVFVTPARARETHRRELVRCTAVEPYVWKPSSQIRKKDRWQSFDAYLRDRETEGKRPVVIVGWEMLAAIQRDLVAGLAPFGELATVFDEAHRAKAMRRLRWIIDEDGDWESRDLNNTSSAAYRLARASTRRLATTATAIRHRLWDLWGQLSLVEPEGWGVTSSRFLIRHCEAKSNAYGGLDANGMSHIEELQERLAYSVHRVPDDVVTSQLPAKRRAVVRVPLHEQNAPYKWNLKREMGKQNKAAVSGSLDARRRVTQIRLLEAASRKRSRIVKDVKEDMDGTVKGKLLVLTGRKRDAEELARQVATSLKLKVTRAGNRVATALGEGPTVWMAHGEDDESARRLIQDDYMAHPGPCVLVGTIDAWGESLNLQDTDVLNVAMLPYTPGKLDQVEGRVHRLGMSRPTLIRYYIAEESIDEKVASIILDKLPAVEAIVGNNPLDGLSDALKGIEDREAVLQSLWSIYEDNADT